MTSEHFPEKLESNIYLVGKFSMLGYWACSLFFYPCGPSSYLGKVFGTHSQRKGDGERQEKRARFGWKRVAIILSSLLGRASRLFSGDMYPADPNFACRPVSPFLPIFLRYFLRVRECDVSSYEYIHIY